MKLFWGSAARGCDPIAVLAALDRCARACADSEARYAQAGVTVRSPFLRALFDVYRRQRAGFVRDLAGLRRGYRREAGLEEAGEEPGPRSGERPPRDALDDALVLDSVCRTEGASLRVYDVVLAGPFELPDAPRAAVTAHHDAIGLALDDVRGHAFRRG